MTKLLERLLGLERVHLTDGNPLSLQFAAPPAPWIMLAGAVVAGIIVWLVHRREPQSRSHRWMLAILRFGVVMTVLFIAGQPMLVVRRNHVDRSYVAVLLDQSSSMAARDAVNTATTGPADGRSPSRWESALRVLTSPENGLLKKLETRHRVGTWLFSRGAAPVGVEATIDEGLKKSRPMGGATDIVGSIVQVLKETQGNRVAGLVVVSDGRQTGSEEIDDAIAAASARSIPIHVVAIGSSKPRRDLRMATVWAPEDVFLRDTVSVRFDVEAAGLDAPTRVTVEMSDVASHEVMATQTHVVSPQEPLVKGDFQYRPQEAGRRVLQVAVRPCEGELEFDNNSAQTSITAHDEKIGVIFVEETPRFEYRYLKNLLLRESGIESSCLLLGATPGFPQEGSRPIRRFPQSVEELRPYDVIVLGDVDPHGDWLTPVQQSLLVDFVSVRGGGLAFISGERNMPYRLRQTPLEKLLPVEIDPYFYGRYDQSLGDNFHVQLTSEGRASPIFQFEREAGPRQEVSSKLPGLYWFARILGPRPAASVLAVHPTVQSAGGPMPIAVLGRFGAGRTFYLGSDDVWRWRQNFGEVYYDTFWLQVIHTLARSRKLGEGQPWRLETDRRRCEIGEKIHVRLAAADDLPGVDLREVSAQVHDASDDLIGRFTMRPSNADDRGLDGVYRPRQAGVLSLSVDPPGSGEMHKRVSRSITVIAGNPEQRHLEADHEYLQRIAKRTGGRYSEFPAEAPADDHSEAAQAQALADAIPDRSVQIADDIEEPLWDKGVILLFFMILIGTEWIMRRSVGMA